MDIDLEREGTEPKGLGFLHDIFIAVSDVLTDLCNPRKKKKLEVHSTKIFRVILWLVFCWAFFKGLF